MKKYFFILLYFFATLAYANGVQELQKFNQTVQSFSGDFEQTTTSGKKIIKNKGTFLILRPGFFRWTYQSPDEQLIVGDGQIIWQYDIELEQVVKYHQGKQFNDSPAILLANKNLLTSHYNLKDDGQKDGIDYVIAQSKTGNDSYKNIRIGFKSGQLNRLSMEDAFGNNIEIIFNKILLNQKVSKKDFQFTVPKGVDVLEAQ